ncbi:type II secretion system minor pseudopilin GspI [Pseudocolwellia agarivorans]|uniref:type II secretion system minor pseudopilin GspI n=1 Tax=Pseudocolwellia agarivorans TaxID=1911682 RepID=UPI00098690D0|nr:type II secretion system minor pseudopilin GspI [Pseudocolwellia agarivorans]
MSNAQSFQQNIKRKCSGFTLIEVMLAMAIFATAGVALISSTDTHFRSLSHLETKMMANWVASNQLVEASLNKSWPPRNNKKGKVELAGREWFWIQKVAKTADQNMSAISIEVRLDQAQRSSLTSLTTYVVKEQK